MKAVSDCGESNTLCKIVDVFTGLSIKDVRTEVHQNNLFYSVGFQVVGGDGPIIIDGVSGVYNPVIKTFTSDLINCGDAYVISITDKNECQVILSGMGECNCVTEAGRMPMSDLETCGDRPIFVGPGTGFLADSNDVETYVLLDQAAFDRSKIIHIQADGIFSNDQGLFEEDQLYYVFHLVGNELPGGMVDLDDPCLGYSNPRSIIFHSSPVAYAGRDTLYCEKAFSLRAVRSKSQSTGILDSDSWAVNGCY